MTTTAEEGLITAPDEMQLMFALSQGRVLVTHDDDFLGLHQSDMEHAGIAYCNQNHRSIGEILRGLILIWEVPDSEDMCNQLEFL